MSEQWVASSAELPCEGQPVEFLLDGRHVAVGGNYVRQMFCSQWNAYDIGRVRNWRAKVADPFRRRPVEPRIRGGGVAIDRVEVVDARASIAKP